MVKRPQFPQLLSPWRSMARRRPSLLVVRLLEKPRRYPTRRRRRRLLPLRSSPWHLSSFRGVAPEGRPKSCRWTEDSDCTEDDCSDEESSPKAPTYLDVVRRQPRPASPPPVRPRLRSVVVQGPDGAAARKLGQGGGGVKAARSKRCRPCPQLIHGLPIRSRSDGVRRLPVFQRLGPRVLSTSRRRLSAPDADGWQKVLVRELSEGCAGPRTAPTRPA